METRKKFIYFLIYYKRLSTLFQSGSNRSTSNRFGSWTQTDSIFETFLYLYPEIFFNLLKSKKGVLGKRSKEVKIDQIIRKSVNNNL